LCGTVPFGDMAHSVSIVVEIMEGTRPQEAGECSEYWVYAQCWSPYSSARPTLGVVLSGLREAARRWPGGGKFELEVQ
jgi:hypothetical protein